MTERTFRFDTCNSAGALHHFLDHMENIFLVWERHFDVNLRELGLPIGAQVLVAETFDDLEVAIHPRDHQNLFEDLWRLRQRVKLPVMNAAGNEIVARAFRYRTGEHPRLDLAESQLVHRRAHLENHAMAQFEVLMRARTPQIEIAIANPRFLASVHFVFYLERRRLRIVQNVQARRDYFHFAGRNFRVRLLAPHYATFHRDNKFRAQLFGLRVRFGMQLIVEHDLRDSRAVAQVDEDQLAEIATALNPAHQDDFFIGVRDAQRPAIIFAFQISESFEQFCRPLLFYPSGFAFISTGVFYPTLLPPIRKLQ